MDQQREERGYSAGEGYGCLCALERGDFVFELAHRRIAPTRVDPAGFVAHRFSRKGRVSAGDERGGHDEVGRGCVGDGVGALTRMDCQGSKSKPTAFIHVVCQGVSLEMEC